MDVNLTGTIASQIALNLAQPWYNPIINVIAGVIGGLIALAGVWITQKNEARKARRDDRKKAYSDFISLMLKAAKAGNIDSEALGNSVIQLQLLGSKSIVVKLAGITKDLLAETDIKKRMSILGKLIDEVVPLMRKDLLLEKDDSLSDNQKAEAEQYWQKIGEK